MNWPKCPNCNSEKVSVAVNEKTERCKCCGGYNHLRVFGWVAWCYDCDLWGDLCDTPQEALKNFEEKEEEF